MAFYHYTASSRLRGIAKHGLTVGDVPTDLERNKGRNGVWLTTSPENTGHGLSGTTIQKKRYRLTIELPPADLVVRWSEWAPGTTTVATINNLKVCAGNDGPSQWETWHIRFGVIPPSAIVACYDMLLKEDVPGWGDFFPREQDTLSVPAWRRDMWHRQLLKNFNRVMRVRESHGQKLVF